MAAPKLLLISYLFPPAGGIAVQRALSLAKYLPWHGIAVHVLKARNPAVATHDPSLLAQVPDAVAIHAAFTPEIPFRWRHALWNLISRLGSKPKPQTADAAAPKPRPLVQRVIQRILCPEPEILWAPFAIRKARQIIRRHAIDAVLVTAPPFSAFLVGNALKREFPQLKLISDFRDEWLDFYLQDFEFQNAAHTRRRAAAIERETVRLSDLVVAVTPSTLETMRRRYPSEPQEKFACIANGFDPEVFRNFRPRPHGLDRVVVTHLGTAYKTASPRYYLDALDAMPEQVRSRIETRFIGRITDAERRIIEGRKSPVQMLGFLPQAEALRRVEETDFLLLTMTNDISLPGKLFEYLAMNKPVLALCSAASEVRRLLETTGAGLWAPYDDPAAIQQMLQRACDSVSSNAPLCVSKPEEIARYERPRLARDYARKIHQLLGAPFSAAAPATANPVEADLLRPLRS